MIIISKENYKDVVTEINKELENFSGVILGRLSVYCDKVTASLDDTILNIQFHLNDDDKINKKCNPKLLKNGLQVGDIFIDTTKNEYIKVEPNNDMDALEFTVLSQE